VSEAAQEEGCWRWRLGPSHCAHPTSGVLALALGTLFPVAGRTLSEGSRLGEAKAPSARFRISVSTQGSMKAR
jgi:hypothetical protein